MQFRAMWTTTLVLSLVVGFMSACSRSPQLVHQSWNAKAAAVYLDQRENTWMGWPGAARDHGTFCVSCHTVVPYILSRPELHKVLGEQPNSSEERLIVENVKKRVLLWEQVEPYYTDSGYGYGKPAESRGTESVLNALILASNDAQSGKLSDVTRLAFSNMWALQQTSGEAKGAWQWLQFGMEPWEAKDSRYYGTALAAVAVGIAPENYRSSPDIQGRLTLLRDYLRRDATQQSMMNRVVLLWAGIKLPGLIDAGQQQAIIREVCHEQGSDGGWVLSSNVWPGTWNLRSMLKRRVRADLTRQDQASDGYATGLITYVLQEAGVAAQDQHLERGLEWLQQNQNRDDGSWPSVSLSQRRNPSSNVGHFMRDAASAYAVLALAERELKGARSAIGQNPSRRRGLTSSQ